MNSFGSTTERMIKMIASRLDSTERRFFFVGFPSGGDFSIAAFPTLNHAAMKHTSSPGNKAQQKYLQQ